MSRAESALDPLLEAALARLEALDLHAVSDDSVALAQAIIERQYALDQLKGFSLSAVPTAEQVKTRARIEALLHRDAEIMQLLSEARESVGGQLGQLVSGRALVRSYGGLCAENTGSVKRTG